MFELEQAIADWRQRMLAAGIQAPVPLEELESHLREEIGRLEKSGLEAPAAFHSAIENIGPAHSLRSEFEKVGKVRNFNGKWFEILFYNYTALFALLFVFENRNFLEMTSGQRISSCLSVVAFSLIAWGVQWSSGKFPTVRTVRIGCAVAWSVMLLTCIFDFIILPRADLDQSQRAVVSLWGFTTAARKKRQLGVSDPKKPTR
jgi:hypothetical protein